MKILNNKFQKTLCISIALLFSVSLLAGTGSKRKYHKNTISGNFVKNEILVKFKKSTSSRYKISSVNSKGGIVLREIEKSGITHVKIEDSITVEEAILRMNSDPNVEYAQPNYIYRALAVPNDTDYSDLWGLKNTGQTVSGGSYSTNNPGTSEKDMDLESAWDEITDCSSVTVAVLDTGVNYNHEDLSSNMWDGGTEYPNHGYDFVDSDNDPMDLNGHGTHIAGTIGAVGNNSAGTTGVCWQVNIMAARVLDAAGSGTTADIVSGLGFAVDNGAKVVNISIGGSNDDSAFSNAINNAKNNGVVIVAAAGNDGLNLNSDSMYPCEYSQSNIVCVAALDQKYELADFSNYGSYNVDVGAPGTNIRSGWFANESTITDNFSGDWTKTGAWTETDCDFGSGAKDMLVNPANWCSSGTYANSASDEAYKEFDLSSYLSAVLSFYAFVDTELNYDYFNINYKSSGGDPFSGGVQVASISGTTDDYAVLFEYDITDCISGNCSVGFQLTSDSLIVDYGIGILEFSIRVPTVSNTEYKVINGTSMAAPHAAGLAAMLFAYNPDYTYSDVVNSIKYGGDDVSALDGKTTTGKAVDAWGSLKYINRPTGVTVSQ